MEKNLKVNQVPVPLSQRLIQTSPTFCRSQHSLRAKSQDPMTQVTCTTPAVFCSCFCCKLQEHVYTTHLISALLLTGNSFCHLRQPDGPNFYVAVLLEALKVIPCKGSHHLSPYKKVFLTARAFYRHPRSESQP